MPDPKTGESVTELETDELSNEALEPLALNQLEEEFGPVVEIADELQDALAQPLIPDTPLVGDQRVLWGILATGALIFATLIVQTVLLLRAPSPAAPVNSPEVSALDDSAEALLKEALAQVEQGFYQDVVDQLVVLEPQAASLTAEQRFRLFSTLSLAYRRLHRPDKAAEYTARATHQLVEHRSVSGLVGEASNALRRGDQETARQIFAQVLARADALGEEDKSQVSAARIGLAQCYLDVVAQLSGGVVLPGAPDDLLLLSDPER